MTAHDHCDDTRSDAAAPADVVHVSPAAGTAVVASSNVGLLVHPWFARRFRGGFYADGVNPFSAWCVVDYVRQSLSGLSAVTAPRHTWNGGRMPWHRLHSAWNVGAIAAMLPTNGPGSSRHVWVTPTVGGHIDLLRVLLVSGPWVFRLYQQGYEQALSLDQQGYFHELSGRRRTADVA